MDSLKQGGLDRLPAPSNTHASIVSKQGVSFKEVLRRAGN